MTWRVENDILPFQNSIPVGLRTPVCILTFKRIVSRRFYEREGASTPKNLQPVLK